MAPPTRGTSLNDNPTEDTLSTQTATIEDKLKRLIAEQLGVNEDEILPKSDFIEDLGCDSLDVVEILMAVEEEFELEVPDDEAELVKTVQDAVNYITKHKQQ